MLWHPNYNRVCRESAYPKGALSFTYQDIAQRFLPVPVISLYSAPIGSVLNSGGKYWSDDIMANVAAESRRLMLLYGFVFAIGDFNWRMGSGFGRVSDDNIKHAHNARTQKAVD